MDFLVVGGANIIGLPDVSNITDHQGLDALFTQRRDKSARGFVFDILNLMFDLPQLLLLGLDELLTTARASLEPRNLAIQIGDKLVAILPLRAEITPIKNVGLFAIMGNRHVDFS